MSQDAELRRRAAELVARERRKFLPAFVRKFLAGVATGLALAAALLWLAGA